MHEMSLMESVLEIACETALKAGASKVTTIRLDIGALGGVMGSLQALEVVKELLELGDSLSGRLLLYDALRGDVRTVRLRRDPHCRTCGSTAA